MIWSYSNQEFGHFEWSESFDGGRSCWEAGFLLQVNDASSAMTDMCVIEVLTCQLGPSYTAIFFSSSWNEQKQNNNVQSESSKRSFGALFDAYLCIRFPLLQLLFASLVLSTVEDRLSAEPSTRMTTMTHACVLTTRSSKIFFSFTSSANSSSTSLRAARS